MGKIKTPVIQPLRMKGGTLFTFASAVEDIGLNINEINNRVRLSHYAILDIPDADETDTNPNRNKFNVFSMPDAMHRRRNSGFTTEGDANNQNYWGSNQTPSCHDMISQSFMSYALNFETAIRNNGVGTRNEPYDYTTSLSVSERVFWKWLKETGAIRWTRKYDSSYLIEGDSSVYAYDNNQVSEYSSVVKAFGKIDGVAQRSSDYGMYNEVFVNIPSSFGAIERSNVLFREVEDNNYKYGGSVRCSENSDYLQNRQNDGNIYPSGLYNVAFYDYSDGTDNTTVSFKTDGSDGCWCKEMFGVDDNNREEGYYIIDDRPADDASMNYLVEVGGNSGNETNVDINYSFYRSKADCLCLELNLNNINRERVEHMDPNVDELVDYTSYDELNITRDDENRKYTFNTILIYYSIYDVNGNILATNLYGVYFLDAPVDANAADGDILNFELPRLTKIPSSPAGFGTSYAFRVNVRTTSIYDDTTSTINDNSNSENSIVTDFNDVVYQLNRSVELLGRHTANTKVLIEQYNDMFESLVNMGNRLSNCEKNIDLLLNRRDIVADNITTNTLSIDKWLKFNDSLDVIGNQDCSVMRFEAKEYYNDRGEVERVDSSVKIYSPTTVDNSLSAIDGSFARVITPEIALNGSNRLSVTRNGNVLAYVDSSLGNPIINTGDTYNLVKKLFANEIKDTNYENGIPLVINDELMNEIFDNLTFYRNGNAIDAVIRNLGTGFISHDRGDIKLDLITLIYLCLAGLGYIYKNMDGQNEFEKLGFTVISATDAMVVGDTVNGEGGTVVQSADTVYIDTEGDDSSIEIVNGENNINMTDDIENLE